MTSSRPVVLLVEDNLLTRMDVAGALEASGWTVMQAPGGRTTHATPIATKLSGRLDPH